jgi:hypothetical protein
MFERPFSFEGRIRRTEYGISMIIYFFLIAILNSIVEESEALIFLLAYIPLVWFLWAQNAKRCHDLGNSGWWQLVPFYSLWLLFQDGQPYTNSYGLNPKGLGLHIDGYTTIKMEEALQHPPIVEENHAIGTTRLEVNNASYGNIQDILRQLRTIGHVNQLNFDGIRPTNYRSVDLLKFCG